MIAEGKVDQVTENGIATISFFHPQSNSLPGTLLTELADSIRKADADESSGVIIIKSDGEKAFCAGASFDELVAINDMETGRQFFSGFANVINAMRTASKFVIVRIQGKTVGGGVGVAAAADYAIALDTASVKLSELAVGIGPFVVGPAVERKVGTSAFSAMAVNATKWWSAEWALEKGLYNEVFPDVAELDDHVMKLAAKLSASSPEAMKKLKKIFWEGTDHWDQLLRERAEISGQLVLSDFTREAIRKFKAGAR